MLRERARTLVPVADAEEAVAAADTELRRVAQLASTIGLTIRFLEAAQQRVHRDIAPVLAATLTQWLPRVTAARYLGERGSSDIEGKGVWRDENGVTRIGCRTGQQSRCICCCGSR